MKRIAVLGGTSIFAVNLIRALRSQVNDLHVHVVLQGRDSSLGQALCLLGNQAGGQLSFGYESDVMRAIEGADLVIHQPRYGGLELRLVGERLAATHSCPADETLGPAALLTLLSMSNEVRRIARVISSHNPQAVVLNLTNPMSSVCSLMKQEALANVYGVCELAWVTVEECAANLGLLVSDCEWSYWGLNHRGFIALTAAGRDVTPAAVESMAEAAACAELAEDIRRLRAIPTKYHSLLCCPHTLAHQSRALALIRLRESVRPQIIADPLNSDAGLTSRPTPWYDKATVPLALAFLGGRAFRSSINLPDANGVFVELMAEVKGHSVEVAEQPAPNSVVQDYVQRFYAHERKMLEAEREPTVRHIEAALRADPLMQDRECAHLANDIRLAALAKA